MHYSGLNVGETLSLQDFIKKFKLKHSVVLKNLRHKPLKYKGYTVSYDAKNLPITFTK